MPKRDAEDNNKVSPQNHVPEATNMLVEFHPIWTVIGEFNMILFYLHFCVFEFKWSENHHLFTDVQCLMHCEINVTVPSFNKNGSNMPQATEMLLLPDSTFPVTDWVLIVENQYDCSHQWDRMSDQHVFCDVAFSCLMWVHAARLLTDLATGWSQLSELGSRTQDSPLGRKEEKTVEEF